MPKTASKQPKHRDTSGAQEDPAVVEFLRTLDHPGKAQVEAVRRIILGVDPAIREAIKWNAPSFFTSEHFATFTLRGSDRVRLILHLGAKVRDTAKTGIDIPDPAGLLEWAARDRAIVTFVDAADVEARREPLRDILRAWIRLV